MHHKPVVQPDFFAFDFSSFNPAFYTLLSFSFHVFKEVFKICELIIANLLVSFGVYVGNKNSVRKFGIPGTKYTGYDLAVIVGFYRASKDQVFVVISV